ncbi:MAG: hypothetical protein ACRDFS_01575, partial [Chloroflexota bacterium]
MPIRLRLTLWFSVLLALSLLALSVAVYLLMSHELLSNLDGSLTDQIHQANASISVNDTRVSVPHADDLTDGPIVPEVVVSRNHKVIAGALPDTLDDWLAGQNLGLGHARIQSVADFRVGL